MGRGGGEPVKISQNSTGRLKRKTCANIANVIVMNCEGFFPLF